MLAAYDAMLRRFKTDREGKGEIVWLAPDTVGLVRGWIESGATAGGRLGDRLQSGQAPRIFKAMAHRARMPRRRANAAAPQGVRAIRRGVNPGPGAHGNSRRHPRGS